VALAFPIYSPTYNAYAPYMKGICSNPPFIWSCVAVWIFAELSNLHTHLTLCSLHPPGSKKRAVPHGYGFSFVSFPNYFFEIIAWSAIATMTGSYAAWIFVAVSSYTMTTWALEKHTAYQNDFGDEYPKDRKTIFPYIL